MCQLASSYYSGFSTNASPLERPFLATQSKVAPSLPPNLSPAQSAALLLHILYHYQTLSPFKNIFSWAFFLLYLCVRMQVMGREILLFLRTKIVLWEPSKVCDTHRCIHTQTHTSNENWKILAPTVAENISLSGRRKGRAVHPWS